MIVRITRRARDDLDEIFTFMAEQNPSAASRVRQVILDAIAAIGARPYLGIQNARAPHLRSRLVSRYQFRIHYELSGDEVRIVHIRHTARRPYEPDRTSP